MKLNIQLFADGSVEIEAKLETRTFEKQIEEVEADLESLNEEYEKLLNDPNADPKTLKEYRTAIKDAEKELANLEEQQTKVTTGSSGMSGLLGKMAKWGLAIFSIRSAYMLVRQATNQIAQENDEIAQKITTIRGSLTNLLAPAVEVIVNLVYRLLSYLNVLTKEFLGIDLFAKSNKGAKATLGTAKQLRKTIAGFDEMNVLNDNVSGGGGAGTPKLPTPEPPDTSNFQKYIENFKKMWGEILEIDRTSAKEIILNSDKTWGLFKLGAFDTTQGVVFAFQGLLDFFGGFWKIIRGLAEGNEQLIWQGVEQLIGGIAKGFRGLIQTIVGLFEMVTGVGYGLGKEIHDGIRKWIDKIIEKFNNFVGKVNGCFTNIRDKVNNKIEEIKKSLTDKFGTIGTTLGNIVGNAFKNSINSALKIIESIINSPIRQINNLISVINKIPGVKQMSTLKTISIPKLAKGGIINMPGKGVPIGSAIGGETGKEGVIPLTDSQQMALLGEAIGRYITINANITNTMNGRIISRELQKIQNENNFAGNR